MVTKNEDLNQRFMSSDLIQDKSKNSQKLKKITNLFQVVTFAVIISNHQDIKKRQNLTNYEKEQSLMIILLIIILILKVIHLYLK